MELVAGDVLRLHETALDRSQKGLRPLTVTQLSSLRRWLSQAHGCVKFTNALAANQTAMQELLVIVGKKMGASAKVGDWTEDVVAKVQLELRNLLLSHVQLHEDQLLGPGTTAGFSLKAMTATIPVAHNFKQVFKPIAIDVLLLTEKAGRKTKRKELLRRFLKAGKPHASDAKIKDKFLDLLSNYWCTHAHERTHARTRTHTHVRT